MSLFLYNPTWTVDATAMAITPEALATLPWEPVMAEMAALEEGALANVDEQRQVGHYWLRAPELAPTMGQAAAIGDAIEQTASLVSQVHAGQTVASDGRPFTDVLHIGIGGSALGPQLLVDALAATHRVGVHFLDNTDPDGIGRVLQSLGDRLCTTLVTVVSKSGGTPETMNALALVEAALGRVGQPLAPHAVAITVPGSKLDQRATEDRWLASLPLWDWVGGRTSTMGAPGLWTAGLAGVDTGELLAGAREMDVWTRETDPLRNPAAVLAGSWFCVGHGHGDRAMVVMPYADRLQRLSRVLQQLVMESIGQRLDRKGNVVHQGMSVFGNKGSTDQHAMVQQLRDGRNDAHVLLMQVLADGPSAPPGSAGAGDDLQGFLLGTRRALTERGMPTMVLTVPGVSPRVVGGLVALFERAVGFYASLVDVNGYHQPGVEAGKKAAKALLLLKVAVLAELAAGPSTEENLAAALEADPIEVHYLLRRLVATQRTVAEGRRFRLWSAARDG
jgi:glucose-6-phosphate isomerase